MMQMDAWRIWLILTWAEHNRQLMQSGELSVEDGLEMRNLLAFPGGLELHIGVNIKPAHA